MPVGLLATSACVGLKSLKTVNAASLPGPFTASRLALGSGCPSGAGRSLPGATHPPVAGSSDVNLKLVGVARAARETIDVQVEPATPHSLPDTNPIWGGVSAVLWWQPRQKG